MKKKILAFACLMAMLLASFAMADTKVYKMGDTVSWHHTSTTQWGTAYYPHVVKLTEENIKNGSVKLITATCTAQGTVTVTSRERESPNTPTGSERWCTQSRTVTVEAIGHHVEEYTTTPGTCQSNAYRTGNCTRCGVPVSEEIPNTKTDHTFENYQVSAPATCVSPATLTAKCEHCNETDSMADPAGTLDPENHADIVILPAVAPTKESTGLTEGKHCNACNTTLVAQEVVMMLPATGDGAMPALWIALIAVGVIGMIAVMKKKRAY
ncbi:MAG: LPXTG cell wall anchor domain-containing protein [Clostridia bacterium]|nr:LPXTG cell wall anchor domain-containing protein [Clostridia bacterium]